MVRLEGFLNTKYFMLITQKNLIFCFYQMYCSGECPSYQAQVMCLLFLPFIPLSYLERFCPLFSESDWFCCSFCCSSNVVRTQLVWF